MPQTLKTITFSLLLLAICTHSWNWISKCENLYGQGRTYDKRTTQTCQLIWDHMTYDNIKNH